MKIWQKYFLLFPVILLHLTPIMLSQVGEKASDGQELVPTVGYSIPKVIKIDELSIKELLKPNGKPLLVNFWATWCIPCREEFPDLVEIDRNYRGKIDLITVSLDDLAEIERDVPKFLTEMKATMPAYLLYTTDENEVIGSISKDWEGGLPFTVLYDENGKLIHTRQGKIKPQTVREKLNTLIYGEDIITVTELVRILDGNRADAVFYYRNNWEVLREVALKKAYIHSYELVLADPGDEQRFDIMLITRYRGKSAYENAESRFRAIIEQTRPAGVKLKSALKPSEFRKNLSVTVGKSIAFPKVIDPRATESNKNQPLKKID